MDHAAMSACVADTLRRAARAATHHFDGRLRGLDVNVGQLAALAVALQSGPTPVADLAQRLGLDRTTLARNLKPMESKGWIRFSPSDRDGRIRLVEVTPKGEELLEQAYPAWSAAQEELLDAFGRKEWSDLRDALSRLLTTT